jgi:hypothetical protein
VNLGVLYPETLPLNQSGLDEASPLVGSAVGMQCIARPQRMVDVEDSQDHDEVRFRV